MEAVHKFELVVESVGERLAVVHTIVVAGNIQIWSIVEGQNVASWHFIIHYSKLQIIIIVSKIVLFSPLEVVDRMNVMDHGYAVVRTFVVAISILSYMK